MKAKLLKPSRVKNTLYSTADHKAALRSGEDYPHRNTMEVEAGYIVDDPEAWRLCAPGHLNTSPVAEPADEECKARVAQWMTNERPELLKQMQSQVENRAHVKDDRLREELKRIGLAYGFIKDAASSKGKADK